MCSPYGIDSSNPSASPTASAATSAASPSRQNRFPIRERRSYCRRAGGYRGTCGRRSPRRASGAMRPTLGAELVDGDVRDEPRGLEGFARHRAGRVRGQPRLNRGALVGVAVDRAVYGQGATVKDARSSYCMGVLKTVRASCLIPDWVNHLQSRYWAAQLVVRPLSSRAEGALG